MKGLVVLALIGVAALSWLAGPEPGLLLLSGTVLMGLGVFARRVRLARKEQS